MARPGSARALNLAVILALVVLALLFWKLRIIDPPDDALTSNLTNVDFFTYILPSSTGAARALLEGRVPLWNPYQASGHPQLASIPVGALYPGNFFYLLLPAPLAIEATVVLHLVAAGVFMFLFGRSIGLEPVAAVAGAITFMLSGFLASRAVWFTPALSACAWLPLALMAIEKIFARPRGGWMVVLAIAIAMPILAGWLQIWLYTMYAIGIYGGLHFVTLLFGGDRRRAPVVAVLLVGGVVLGLCLCAVQLLPTFELQALGPRKTGTLSPTHSMLFNAPAQHLISMAIHPTPGQSRWVYLGMVTLVLIPISAFAGRRRISVVSLWCIFLLGAIVALTATTPLFLWFAKLPTGDWFRAPQRILFLHAFAGSALTAVAIQSIVNLRAEAPAWVRSAAVGTAVTVATVLSWHYDVTPLGLAYLWIGVAAVIAVTFVGHPRARMGIAIGLVGLLGVDLFFATRNPFPHPYHFPELRAQEPEREVFDWIRGHQGLQRSYVRSPSKLYFNVMAKHATLEQIRSITDYEPLSLSRRADFFRKLERRTDETLAKRPFNGWLDADPTSPHFALLDLMSVRYIALHKNEFDYIRQITNRGWISAFRPQRGGDFVIYENRRALPRAYLALGVVPVATAAEALERVSSRAFDPRREVVIEDPDGGVEARPPRPRDWVRPVQMMESGPEEIIIETNAEAEGFLVLTDTHYPGWKASLDEHPVVIHRANHLFRGVRVPAGRHRIRFSYEPVGFAGGAVLSLTGLLGIALYLLGSLVSRLRRRRASGAAVLLVAALMGFGCGSQEVEGTAEAPRASARPQKPSNVIVFVIDTLRADHLGAYGYARDVSPVIDGLALDGVVFEETSAVAPRTWQSFTSILTGLYPPRHGVRYIFSPPLSGEIPTLASVLASNGYQTAAFDGMNFLRAMTGQKAFQSYRDPVSMPTKSGMMSDDALIDAMIEWIDASERPFFAFLRLTAPHWTYRCNPIFHDEVVDHDSISHAFNAGTHGLGLQDGALGINDMDAYRKRFYEYELTPVEHEHMLLHYDECIRETDSAIGRGLAHLREKGLRESTLIVVTADHGESFGEHGYLQHGPQVDGPVVDIPLIVHFPAPLAAERRGKRIAQLSRSVDVLPTVLDILGIEPPADLDGASLLPVIDESAAFTQTAYAEGGRAFVGVDPEIYLPGVAGKHRMIRDRSWKLLFIPNEGEGIVRLYDLENDPGETTDVAASHPEVVERLRERLDAVMIHKAGAGEEPELSDEEKDRLRALGYL